jgi:hypothetical protein
LIEAQIPERFWSMQFYQMNTDNYVGISNLRIPPNVNGHFAPS